MQRDDPSQAPHKQRFQFKFQFAIFHQGFRHMLKGPRARRLDVVINAKAKPALFWAKQSNEMRTLQRHFRSPKTPVTTFEHIP